MVEIFQELLYRPLLNILVIFYNWIPDLGISIILLTLIIRILLSPLTIKSYKAQKILIELQPKIKEIQTKYRGDPQKSNEALMRLYKESKVNPFSGCLPILIQFPLLIALYQVFLKITNPEELANLYYFVKSPESLNPEFFGLINLAKSSSELAVLAGIFQFIQAKMMPFSQKIFSKKKQDDTASQLSQIMTKQMTYFMPFFLVLIAWTLPAALPLYWIVITLFSIGEQYYINKKFTTKL